MKAPRIALSMVAAATLAAGALLVIPANAAPGDTWSGFKVVDVKVQPGNTAATTQTDVLGMMPRYKQGGDEFYLWNIVRMVTDKYGNESWVYCIEQKVQGEAPTYVEDPSKGTALGQANATKINRVLANSTLPDPGDLQVTAPDGNWVNPAVHVLPSKKSDHIEVTAVQLALWHFTDGLNFNASNTVEIRDYYPNSYVGDADEATIGDVLARYDTLVAQAEANPLANPDPEITIAPATTTVDAGNDVVLTVTGNDIEGGIKVESNDASVDVFTASGDDCTTTTVTSLPSDGGTVCVTSDGARSLKVTASGHSAGNSTHTLYALGAQTLIGFGPDPAEDDATVTWTAVQTTSTPTSTQFTPTSTPTTTPSTTPSESSTGTPSVSETSSTGGAVVETTGTGGGGGGNNAVVAETGALADTGALGLLDRLALALAALALGTTFVLVTRRRSQGTH